MDITHARTEAAAAYRKRLATMDTQIRIATVAHTRLGKIVEGQHVDRILGALYGDMAHGTRAIHRVPFLLKSNILRLKWADIDFDQNVLIVRKSKTRSGRGRRVGLNSLLRQTLVSSFEKEHGEWVFPSPKRFQKPDAGERHIGDVKNSFRRAVRLSAIDPITFHQLRHTFCSRLANAGIPMPVIQDLAGHASIIMTRRYTHPSEELKQKAVETLLTGQTAVLAATKSATKVHNPTNSQIGEAANTSRSTT